MILLEALKAFRRDAPEAHLDKFGAKHFIEADIQPEKVAELLDGMLGLLNGLQKLAAFFLQGTHAVNQLHDILIDLRAGHFEPVDIHPRRRMVGSGQNIGQLLEAGGIGVLFIEGGKSLDVLQVIHSGLRLEVPAFAADVDYVVQLLEAADLVHHFDFFNSQS